jgi:SAM-dependent methyltransferase
MASGRRLPDVAEVRAHLSQFNFFERYANGPEEGDVYLATHGRRFVETLNRLPSLPDVPLILELGAVPYSMTILLRRYFQADVSTLSLYEVEGGPGTHVLESRDRRHRHEFAYQPVNVERDIFPFPDGAFDLVLCCEILEHLLINPSHMLFEAHRVLRPAGHLVVTTPNVVRDQNLRAILEGRNINDAYHGNGIYGRHNREYAPAEVPLILEACGYEIVSHEVINVYDTSPAEVPRGREDTIVTVARAAGPRRIATPSSLYVLMDEYRNVVRSSFTMGVDEVGHLGPGWYDLECDGEQHFRWTRQAAVFHLRVRTATTIGVHVQVHHPDLAAKPLGVNVRVADHQVAAVIADHRWQDVEFRLPAPIDGSVRIQLEVDRDWSPGDAHGSLDSRRLGLRMHRCWAR